MSRLASAALALAATTAALALPSSAMASVGIGKATSFAAKFTTKTPNSPSGLMLRTTGALPHEEITLAPAVRQTVTLPAGTKLDVGALEQCEATSAQLVADGAQVACPASTKIGSGIAVGSLDGARASFDLAVYPINGRLFFAGEQNGVPLKVGFDGIITGRKIALSVPTMNGRIAPTLFRAKLDERGGWLRTPKSCPAGGKWKTLGTFEGLTAIDGKRVGLRQTLPGTTPCRG